jgi:hypothetical protein
MYVRRPENGTGRSFSSNRASIEGTTVAFAFTSKISKLAAFGLKWPYKNTEQKTMKISRASIFLSIALTLVAGVSAYGQFGTFSDPNADYTFDLPDERWKMTAKPSATKPNVEYVFIDRNDGHLEVRKLSVAKGSILADIMRDEELRLQFLPGYVAGRDENFSGHLRGSVFNFEFVRAGRPMSGRFYFLRPNDTTVYVLRFTGHRDKLRSIRNQTDSIGRTFDIQKGA